MSVDPPIATLPVAWLRPLPEGYVIPIWRWLLLPATAVMLKRYRGVWVSGELKLVPSGIGFTQSKLVKSSRNPLMQWDIALDSISDVSMRKGIASETIEILHAGQTTKLMTARSADFLALLDEARSSRRKRS